MTEQQDALGAIEIGVINTLPSTLRMIELAKAAERFGFDRLGISDTAPRLYHACYPAVTGCLLATDRIKVGPYVTNPVTRHWSVHAASAKAFEEIAPGRFFLGIATGDGAVHSVGLHPAKLADFAAHIADMQTLWPAGAPIHMAFSGTKGMEIVGRLASEVTIGTGLDAGAIRDLSGRAHAARLAAGVTAPLRVFVSAAVFLAENEADVPALRRRVAGLSCHGARFAFDFSFEGKNVPEAWHPIIRDRMRHYDFAYHGKVGDNPNGHLFDDHPEIGDYLIDRFVLAGTADQIRARLSDLARDAGIDGIWLMPAARADTTEAIVEAMAEVAAVLGRG